MRINSASSINFGVKYENSINNILENSLVSATRKGRQTLKSWREVKKVLDNVAPEYSLYIFDDKINSNKEEPIRYSLSSRPYTIDGNLYSKNPTPPSKSITPVTLKKGELLTTDKIKKLISFFKLLEKIDTLKKQQKRPNSNPYLLRLIVKLDNIQNQVRTRLNLYQE